MSPELIDWLASCSSDPEAFVLGAFPWGEEGSRLEAFAGPEPWQTAVLRLIRDGLPLQMAVQIATASGHGVGKSALVSWIILWAICTKPDTRGIVTANTEPQLKGKTWAELGKWYNLCLVKDFFTLSATAIFSIDKAHERTWRIDMAPWSKENTEAFAGLHNQGIRILVLFDEASAIDDLIWEVTEGALTDKNTEIIWCVFGNPTRNTGRFRECWGLFSEFWKRFQVDSRTVAFTNKEQISRWIKVYGEDSDFVRIRVLGVFPRTGMMEFFNADDVKAAMERDVAIARSDPLALGVDVARFGSNASVIYPRKGRDARTIPRQRFNGISTTDLAQRVFDTQASLRPDGIFIDGGGVGGGVVDYCRLLHLHVFEISFGGRVGETGYATGNAGERYANKRAEMYGALRAWLRTGAIPNEVDLQKQLMAITYTFNRKDEIQLIAKEDMDESPDDADALALTFALPLAPHAHAGGEGPKRPLIESEYDPFAAMHGDYDIYREAA